MPDGVQWSWEEVRNAKRAAEYLTEAQRSAAWKAEVDARLAAQQAEREANQARREAEIARYDAEYEAQKAREREARARVAANQPPYQSSIQSEIKWNSGACRSARRHAEAARAAKFGSKEYIMARYGYVCGEFGNSNCYYGTILRSLMGAEGLTEDQAWDRIVSAYTEERWRQCEAPFTEYFLNHVSC